MEKGRSRFSVTADAYGLTNPGISRSLASRLPYRIGTRHPSARASFTGRAIAAMRPSTASARRIDISRKAHAMRLPCPLAHRAGEQSRQTDTAERWLFSVDYPYPASREG